MSFVPQVSKKHPCVWTFYFLLKGLALFAYLFGNRLLDNFYILVFVITVLLLAVDFWFTKNVAGRMLIGYRWWNVVKEDDTSDWKYEATEDLKEVPKRSKILFWSGLFGFTGIWAFFGLFHIIFLRFGWLLICLAGLLFCGTNLYGYLKCTRCFIFVINIFYFEFFFNIIFIS
jgi:hypothetical protein